MTPTNTPVPSFTDTTPKMCALFALLIARAHADIDKPMAIARIVQSLRRLLKAIIMAEVHEFKTALKAAMLRDPAWKRRVIMDLGGVHVLKRWRTAFYWRGSNAEAVSPPIVTPMMTSKPAPARPKTAAPAPPCQTDASGHFRLAPVPRSSVSAADRGPRGAYGERQPSSPYDVPIALTPCELFPNSSHPSDVQQNDTEFLKPPEEPVNGKVNDTELGGAGTPPKPP